MTPPPDRPAGTDRDEDDAEGSDRNGNGADWEFRERDENGVEAVDRTDPRLPPRTRFARRFNRAYHRRLGRRTHDPTGIDAMAADWDVMVVLDACRADVFAETSDLAGRPGRRRSRGSHTVEWLWGNLANRRLHDVVYVTANVQPYVHRGALDCHRVEHVWMDGFDEAAGTVRPATVTDAALAAAGRFPRKRLLVHYLQPHYPFLDAPDFDYGTMAFWDAVAAGDVDASADRLREWHGANLEAALPEVRRLLAALPGRAVVTSDHGTALGERAAPVPVREWGHPWGVYVDPLVTVPWLVRDSTDRPSIVAEVPVEGDELADGEVRERLAALGYA